MALHPERRRRPRHGSARQAAPRKTKNALFLGVPPTAHHKTSLFKKPIAKAAPGAGELVQGGGRGARARGGGCAHPPATRMQAVTQGDGRHAMQIRVSLPPSRTGREPARHPEGPRGARRQHVFRVTYCTVLAEWSTAFIAVGLLSFYLYAILDTKEDRQRDNINYKVRPASCRARGARLPRLPSQRRPWRSQPGPRARACRLTPPPRVLLARVLVRRRANACSLTRTRPPCRPWSRSSWWRTCSCRRTCGYATCSQRSVKLICFSSKAHANHRCCQVLSSRTI